MEIQDDEEMFMSTRRGKKAVNVAAFSPASERET